MRPFSSEFTACIKDDNITKFIQLLEEVKEIVKQAKDCNANKPIMLFDSQTNQNFTLDNEDGTHKKHGTFTNLNDSISFLNDQECILGHNIIDYEIV